MKNHISAVLRVARFVGIAMSFALANHSANAQSGNSYNAAQLRGNVERATVVQVRIVQVETVTREDRMIGTGVGAGFGAVTGHLFAGKKVSTSTRVAVTTMAAAAGGYAGNEITKAVATKDAQEIILQLPSGRMYYVVQPLPAQLVSPGDTVTVLQQQGQTRVVQTSGYMQQNQNGPQLVNYLPSTPRPYQQSAQQTLYGNN